MNATHVLVDQSDLVRLQRKLGRRHPFCKRIREALDDLRNPALARYRTAAVEESLEGHLEVDSGAVVSLGDDEGAYVMAWLWITDEHAGIRRGGSS